MYRVDECAFIFSSRFHTTSQGPSAETRTPSLRILFLRWNVSTQWKCAHEPIVASENMIPHAAHKSALCQRVIIFVFMCVSSHTADSTGCVLVVNRCCQMWSDFIGGTQAGLVRPPGSSYVQQPNCCNPCDGANLLNAGPSLLLGHCPSVWMRRCILTVHLSTATHVQYHFYTLSLTAVWKHHTCLENDIYVSGQWFHYVSVAAQWSP